MNRLVKTTLYPDDTTETTEYFYDNTGNRFIKKASDGTITLYLRHGQIAVNMDVEVNTDQSGKINRYVLSGDLLAGRISIPVDINGDRGTPDKNWYHLDHLNSTKVVTDSLGAVVVNYIYRAFGEQLKRLDAAGEDTDDKAKYSYSGKELDTVTNLY